MQESPDCPPKSDDGGQDLNSLSKVDSKDKDYLDIPPRMFHDDKDIMRRLDQRMAMPHELGPGQDHTGLVDHKGHQDVGTAVHSTSAGMPVTVQQPAQTIPAGLGGTLQGLAHPIAAVSSSQASMSIAGLTTTQPPGLANVLQQTSASNTGQLPAGLMTAGSVAPPTTGLVGVGYAAPIATGSTMMSTSVGSAPGKQGPVMRFPEHPPQGQPGVGLANPPTASPVVPQGGPNGHGLAPPDPNAAMRMQPMKRHLDMEEKDEDSDESAARKRRPRTMQRAIDELGMREEDIRSGSVDYKKAFNRQAARESRERKRMELDHLRHQNVLLQSQMRKVSEECDRYRRKVHELQSSIIAQGGKPPMDDGGPKPEGGSSSDIRDYALVLTSLAGVPSSGAGAGSGLVGVNAAVAAAAAAAAAGTSPGSFSHAVQQAQQAQAHAAHAQAHAAARADGLKGEKEGDEVDKPDGSAEPKDEKTPEEHRAPNPIPGSASVPHSHSLPHPLLPALPQATASAVHAALGLTGASQFSGMSATQPLLPQATIPHMVATGALPRAALMALQPHHQGPSMAQLQSLMNLRTLPQHGGASMSSALGKVDDDGSQGGPPVPEPIPDLTIFQNPPLSANSVRGVMKFALPEPARMTKQAVEAMRVAIAQILCHMAERAYQTCTNRGSQMMDADHVQASLKDMDFAGLNRWLQHILPAALATASQQ
eukprot:Rmarinus@m.15975